MGIKLGESDSEVRAVALAHLLRLTGLMLDNLEEGARNKLMDPKEMRLLGTTAMRTIRLYIKTLEGTPQTESSVRSREDEIKPGKK